MAGKKTRRRRRRQDGPAAAEEPSTGWEERALARVRLHVRQLTDGVGAHEAGWETDTLTRLERYFERDEV